MSPMSLRSSELDRFVDPDPQLWLAVLPRLEDNAVAEKLEQESRSKYQKMAMLRTRRMETYGPWINMFGLFGWFR